MDPFSWPQSGATPALPPRNGELGIPLNRSGGGSIFGQQETSTLLNTISEEISRIRAEIVSSVSSCVQDPDLNSEVLDEFIELRKSYQRTISRLSDLASEEVRLDSDPPEDVMEKRWRILQKRKHLLIKIVKIRASMESILTLEPLVPASDRTGTTAAVVQSPTGENIHFPPVLQQDEPSQRQSKVISAGSVVGIHHFHPYNSTT